MFQPDKDKSSVCTLQLTLGVSLITKFRFLLFIGLNNGIWTSCGWNAKQIYAQKNHNTVSDIFVQIYLDLGIKNVMSNEIITSVAEWEQKAPYGTNHVKYLQIINILAPP